MRWKRFYFGSKEQMDAAARTYERADSSACTTERNTPNYELYIDYQSLQNEPALELEQSAEFAICSQQPGQRQSETFRWFLSQYIVIYHVMLAFFP